MFETRKSSRSMRRRGAVIVESAVLLPVFLVFVFVFLDLGLLVLRQNALAAAAISTGRFVMIRSREFPENDFKIGPESIDATLDLLVDANRYSPPPLPTIPPDDVRLQIQWVGEIAEVKKSAIVTLSYRHHSIIGTLAPWNESELQAVSKVDLAR